MEKVYVEVESRRYGKGYKPLRIKWPDGRVWEIERTLCQQIGSRSLDAEIACNENAEEAP